MIRYHRLIFDSVADGAFRSTYLPWIDSITHVKAEEKEEIELRLNSSYENVWRALKERLNEPAVRLKSQYSSRLYLWAKQYSVVGFKRVSLATLRKILGLEDVKDNSDARRHGPRRERGLESRAKAGIGYLKPILLFFSH